MLLHAMIGRTLEIRKPNLGDMATRLSSSEKFDRLCSIFEAIAHEVEPSLLKLCLDELMTIYKVKLAFTELKGGA